MKRDGSTATHSGYYFKDSKTFFCFSTSQQDFFEELQRKTEVLRAENKAFGDDFGNMINMREKAQSLEKENKLKEAISTYLSSLQMSENSQRLSINNFAFDIHRVIILYGKTKQEELLEEFLEDKIQRYPDFQDTKDWKVRLDKLQFKKG
ncbi:hypothetical protein ES705_50278 [subsurface metagenome]